LYSIFIEFGVCMKLVRLIKMFLNETYSKVRIGKYSKWSKTRRCFSDIAFQLCSRI
jgi:hypothetical protein